MRPFLLSVLLFAGIVPVAAPSAAETPAATPRSNDIALLETLRAGDLRVATVGERLALANVALCSRTEYRTGLLLHDLSQYAGNLQAAARQNFGFDGGVAVEAVVPGSPAAQAGIVANSSLVAIDGEKVAAGTGQGDFSRMASLLDRIDHAVADGTLTLDLRDHAKPVSAVIHAVRGCATRFQIVLGGSVNAGADGRYVQIEGRMVDFVANDDELAAVLAHELAHNILNHRARLDAAGVDRSPLGMLGKSAGMIQATEVEADRLSVYLMANAGYDARATTGLWDRLGRKYGFGIFSDGTHLRRKPRVALFVRELEALDALRKATPTGTPLIPDFAKQPYAPLR